jgi:hypothetical protein
MRSFRLLRRPAAPTAFAFLIVLKKQPGFLKRERDHFQSFPYGNLHFGSYIAFA